MAQTAPISFPDHAPRPERLPASGSLRKRRRDYPRSVARITYRTLRLIRDVEAIHREIGRRTGRRITADRTAARAYGNLRRLVLKEAAALGIDLDAILGPAKHRNRNDRPNVPPREQPAPRPMPDFRSTPDVD